MKELLELRNKRKAKKPDFTSQDSHKSKEAPKSYRRPKGLHSKMRRGLRGYKKRIKTGYKSPVLVKGLTREGLEPVVIMNRGELESIDKKTQIVVLSGKVGLKNKIDILKGVISKELPVMNVKDPKEKLESIKNSLKKKKEKKKKREVSKKEKEKELMQKSEDKAKKDKADKKDKKSEGEPKSVEQIVEDKEDKSKEKKEMDKLLTKKDSV